MKDLQSTALVLLLSTMIAGCGFQLRTADLSSIPSLQLSGAAAAPSVYRALNDMVDASGVTTDANVSNGYRVRLLDERSIRRSVATTTLIDAAEYELRLEVDFQISRGDEILVTDTLIAQRVYSVDAVNLSGSTEEQRLVLDEMRRELSAAILRQIEIISTAS